MRLPRLPSAQRSRTFSSDFLLGGRKQSVGQIWPLPAPVSLLTEVSRGERMPREPPPQLHHHPPAPPPQPNLEASQGQKVEGKKKPGLSLSAQGCLCSTLTSPREGGGAGWSRRPVDWWGVGGVLFLARTTLRVRSKVLTGSGALRTGAALVFAAV